MSGMDAERFEFLMRYETATLTEKEISEGWHFCQEFDGLLMHVGTMGCICDMRASDNEGHA